jgi:hypothetical protein
MISYIKMLRSKLMLEQYSKIKYKIQELGQNKLW